MLDYFIWLALGLIVGYSMGLRKVKDYFNGIDPVELMKDNQTPGYGRHRPMTVGKSYGHYTLIAVTSENLSPSSSRHRNSHMLWLHDLHYTVIDICAMISNEHPMRVQRGVRFMTVITPSWNQRYITQ